MTSYRLPISAFLVLSLLGGTALAQTGAAANPVSTTAPPAANKADPAAANKADPRAAIVKKIDGLKLEDVRMTPVNGIYEITRGSSISYSSVDGRYVIIGDMIDVDADTNITENRRRGLRNGIIGAIPESEMIVFSPKSPKYTVTVFTDIDCGYCRRLHSQMAEYNRLGVRVRYLFYPRSGPNTESWHKAEAVWCSKDRNDAMTRAKNDEAVKAPKCSADVIARDWELGHKLDVEGTPAMLLPSGELLGGYVPPAELVQYLKASKK